MPQSQQNEVVPHSPLLIAFIVASLSMLAPFSIDTYLPSFPAIASDLGASHIQMQQTLSVYLASFAITTLIHGPLSDAFGRRRVVIVALLLYIASSIGAVFSDSIASLLLWRAAQGMTASAGVVVGRAMVRDAFHGHHAQQVMSQVMLIFALAPAIAPIVGGFLENAFGWRSVFWLLTLLGCAAFMLVTVKAPETLPADARQSIHPGLVLGGYADALRSPRFMGLVIAFALNFGGVFLYIAASPSLLYDHLHLGPDDFWMQFVPMVGGLMAGSVAAGRSAKWLSRQRTVQISYLMMIGAGVINMVFSLSLAHTIWSVITPLVVYAFALAFSMPTITLLALDCFPHRRGMAAAMQSFIQVMSNALVASLLVPLLSHQVWTLALGMLGLSAAGFTLWLLQAKLYPEPATS